LPSKWQWRMFSLLISQFICRYRYLECYGFDAFFSSLHMIYAFYLLSCPPCIYIYIFDITLSYCHLPPTARYARTGSNSDLFYSPFYCLPSLIPFHCSISIKYFVLTFFHFCFLFISIFYLFIFPPLCNAARCGTGSRVCVRWSKGAKEKTGEGILVPKLISWFYLSIVDFP